MPADAAVARTEVLLTAVGARRTASYGDAFEAALLDFTCDVDLLAGIAELDAAPIPAAALRVQRKRSGSSAARRPSWRVLVPAMSGGVAALVVAVTLVFVSGSATTGGSALSATAESRQLLGHADMLLTAARTATAAERSRLVTEAKADLTHVSRLLPLAPPPAQPAIRARMQLLNSEVRPLARSGSAERGIRRSGGGSRVSDPGTAETAPPPNGSDGSHETSPPARERLPIRRPPAGAGGQVRTADEPAATQSAPPQRPATLSGGTAAAPQQGTQYPPDARSGTGGQPPPVGAPRPQP